MHIHNFIIAGSLGIVAVAAPASAQNFSGPRVEGRIGWDGTNISIKDTRDFGGRGSFSSGSTASDLSIGGELGFDVESSGFAFGAYAGADFGENDEPFPDRRVTFETGRNFTAGVRGGFVITPSVLLYAKGGYSKARISPKFTTGATTAQQAAFANFDRNPNGFHAGGGVEFAMSGSIYGRLDYAHHKYESFDVDPNSEFSFRRNQVTAAIGFRF